MRERMRSIRRGSRGPRGVCRLVREERSGEVENLVPHGSVGQEQHGLGSDHPHEVARGTHVDHGRILREWPAQGNSEIRLWETALENRIGSVPTPWIVDQLK